MMINVFLNTRIVEGSTGKREERASLSCEANLRAPTSLRTCSREFVTNL